MITLGALDSGLELSVEQIYEDGLLPLQETVPELLADLFVRSIVAIFVFDVGLLADGIYVLVEGLEEDTQHLLAIMLGEPGKLDGFPCHHLLDIPWCHVFLATEEKLGNEASESNG